MVTHNPELAQRYSTRLVRLLDGKIVSDSNPCEETEPEAEPPKKHKRYQHVYLRSSARKPAFPAWAFPKRRLFTMVLYRQSQEKGRAAETGENQEQQPGRGEGTAQMPQGAGQPAGGIALAFWKYQKKDIRGSKAESRRWTISGSCDRRGKTETNGF